jgi:hypothetical protein
MMTVYALLRSRAAALLAVAAVLGALALGSGAPPKCAAD